MSGQNPTTAEERAEQAANDAGVGRGQSGSGERTVTLKWMKDFTPKRVRWLWTNWISCGTLTLISGREESGKSTFLYSLAADVTNGKLPGAFYGQPRAVLIVATEDSINSTIVPRLLAHGADLALVGYIEVKTPEGYDTELSLPDDLTELEAAFVQQAASDVPFAMMGLDPLISRLSPHLDSHKDAEVRQALEPLVDLATKLDVAMVGLIHHNKSTTADPLTAVMGSKAFAAVARQVLTMATDPMDPTEATKLLGQTKNNLGKKRMGTSMYEIQSVVVGSDEDGDIASGRITWKENVPESIDELRLAKKPLFEGAPPMTVAAQAAVWLEDYLEGLGGQDSSNGVLAAGNAAGHSERAIREAASDLKVIVRKGGFQGTNLWILPGYEEDYEATAAISP